MPDLIRGVADRHPEAGRVELWFMDEARIGQKGGLTHVWYQKGLRPRGRRQQGFSSACLFGAVCPERGEGVALARRERDGRVSSRLLALANALDGMSRDEAARAAGTDRQTLRDRVHRYDAEGVEGLRDRPRPGRPCALDEGRQAALKGLILRGPKLERDGCVAWRARDLRALVERRFEVRYSEGGVRRLLRGLDLSWQKARPVHPEADPKAQERFKKTCPA